MTDTILQYLFENTVVFTLLFGGVWLIKTALKRHLSPAMHYIIWAIVLIKLMLPVSFASEISPWNLFIQAQNNPVTQQAYADPQAQGASNTAQQGSNGFNIADYNIPANTSGVQTANNATIAAQASAGQPITAPIQIDWALVILAAWLAGTCATGAWLLIDKSKIARQLQRSKQVKTPVWIWNLIIECKKELNINRRIRVIVQEALPVPAIMGVWKPVLLLPYSATINKDKAQMRHILMHELMHYKRGDLIAITVLNLLCAVYWFNPLVWLCCKLIRKDMETACDNMVVEALGQGRRQEYIHTLVRFAGKSNQARLQAALSLHDARTRLKKRIAGMFMQKKTKLAVKLPVFIIIAVMLATAFTTACQPTPERPVVAGKQDDITAKVTDNGQNSSLAGVPTTFKDSYTQGKVTVNLDAKVEVPQTPKIPVVKAVPERFTQDKVDKVIATLTQGKPIWEPKTVQTKSELQRQLVYYQALLEIWGEKAKEKMDYIINDTKTKLLTAPETVQRKVSDGKLKDAQREPPPKGEEGKPVFDGQELSVEANLGYEYDAKLFITSSTNGKMDSVWYTNADDYIGKYMVYDSIPAGTARGMKTTLAEAQAKAEKTVQDLGCGLKLSCIRLATVNDPAATDPTNPPQAYVFYFTREVNGVPTTYETSDGASDGPVVDNKYVEYYTYEKLYMVIDDTGIVELQWTSPMKLTDTIADNAKLKGFDEVMSIFKTQYFIRNALKVNGQVEDYTYDPQNPNASPKLVEKNYVYNEKITSIKLGLMRLPIKDNPNEYTLVPVWDFFGTEHVEYNEQHLDERTQKTSTSADFDCTVKSILTINAIDGSVITRDEGGQG